MSPVFMLDDHGAAAPAQPPTAEGASPPSVGASSALHFHVIDGPRVVTCAISDEAHADRLASNYALAHPGHHVDVRSCTGELCHA